MMDKTNFSGLCVVLLAAVATGLPQPGQAQENGRLLYEMVVTNPGTRSQGWHGTLYGLDGAPLVAEPGAVVETHVGNFEYVECMVLWRPCGFIRLDTPMRPDVPLGALLDSEAWRYLLYISGEGSRSEGWHGVLYHGEAREMPSLEPVNTPLGAFVWTGGDDRLWGWSGWLPVAWEQPQ